MPLFAGRYEVVRPIAQGGMATVYLAKVRGEGGFERLVALKVMHPHIANEPEFVSMFLDEARLAARIRHPNVVATLAVERNEDGLCLVMEYIDGHPLHAILRTARVAKRYLTVPVVLRIVVDLLEGLHAAHELRGEDGSALDLVHRDVSPQNVLVGVDGVSRITDFGVAHARARLATTQGSSLKGKVAYLAPEQVLTTGGVDRRVDVFAAGIVLWETLTGRRLFRGETEGQTIAQIMGGAKRAPHEARPEVPVPISDACMKALAPNVDDRFHNTVEFADALERAAVQSGIVLAKPREVAAEVLSLEVPEQQIDLAKIRSGASKSASVSGVSRGSVTGVAGPAVSPAPTPPQKPKARRLALAGGGIVLVAGVALALGLHSRGEPPAGASQATAATPATATPEPRPAGAVAPAEPTPAKDEAPVASATAAPAPPPSATTAAAAPGKTPAKPTSGGFRPAKPAAPSYRPEGL